MNHEDHHPDLQTWIEPELEARLVASVLGETSAFESAELERLISEKPELGIFKRRIEAVHGLVSTAVRPEQAPLRLAPERRAKILAAIGAAPARSESAGANNPVLLELAAKRRKRRKTWIWSSGLAASLAFAAILSFSVLRNSPIIFNRERAGQVGDGGEHISSVALPTYMPNEPEPLNTSATDTLVLSPFRVSEPSFTDKLRKALTSPPPELTELSTQGDERVEFAAKEARDASAAISYTTAQEKKPDVDRKKSAPALGMAAQRSGQAPLDLSLQAQVGGTGAGRPRSEGRARREAGPTAQDTEIQNAPRSATTRSLKDITGLDFKAGGLAGGKSGENGANVASPSPNVSSAYFPANAPSSLKVNALSLGAKQKNAEADKSFDAPTAPAAGGAATGVKVEDELVVLSPFEVVAAPDTGYSASSTLSGSRMTTSLGVFDYNVTMPNKRRLDETSSDEIYARFPDDNFLLGGPVDAAGDTSNSRESSITPSAAAIDEQLSQQKAPAPTPPVDAPRGEISTAKEPVSTFSLHVSDVSFRLAQAALARGETPDPARIRPEEFYNAFNYGDPSPTTGEKVGCRIEQAAHPLLQQRNLVRIAMRVPASGRGAGQPLHLTVLLDTSGSMEREDRVASVHRALEVLASLLGTHDRVTLIGFARQPRLLTEQLPGDQAEKLAELASATPFTGGTNLEEALKLASELARRHQDAAAQNRVVLITDGAANLGNADPAQLSAMIEALRQKGIAFDACGVGTDGLDDWILEALTRKGDGRYYVLDRAQDADAGFARQLAGAFRPAAENVKLQVRFNPARVASYRLIGFEQHRLREEDFRNDKVDAAELAAEEAAVALYQVQVLPQGEAELGEVFVRFHDPATNLMVERSWTILHEPHLAAFDRATPTIELAGVAALLAEKLQGGDAAKLIALDDLAPVVNRLRGQYAQDARVQQLIAMFEQLRRRGGK